MFVDLRTHHLDEWGVAYQGSEEDFIGFAEERDGRIVAIGVTYPDAAGRWRLHFAKRPGASIFVHRMMRRLEAGLRAVGVAEVWAECDDTIAGARKWLERGGFVECDGAWRLVLRKD